MLKIWEKINIILICLVGVLLIGFQFKPWAWLIWLIGLVGLLFCSHQFKKDFLLIYISLFLLGITPITTEINVRHILIMGFTLILAAFIPYSISKWIYKDNLIRFKFHHGRKWFKTEIFYIFATVVICYFILPFYLLDTGAYLNWTVEPGWKFLTLLFIGTNALGIWDELFFVSTILGILRRYLKFFWANIVQAILFTSFLFELGFTGWGPIMIFIFAWLQGIIFRKTDSLFYVITIHLALDLVLYLAIIYAHQPSWIPIF